MGIRSGDFLQPTGFGARDNRFGRIVDNPPVGATSRVIIVGAFAKQIELIDCEQNQHTQDAERDRYCPPTKTGNNF